MIRLASRARLVSSYSALAVACVLHASSVFAFWSAEYWADIDLMPTKAWLVLGWLWLAWPVALSLHRDRSLIRVAVPLSIGFAALAVCIPTIFTLTVWSIGGFAP
jgi:hypothetical protein